MRKPLFFVLLFIFSIIPTAAQKPRKPAPRSVRAVVVDNSLAVVRNAPGYFGQTVRRLRRGRELTVLGSKPADGAVFLRVSISPRTNGWIQREAVVVRTAAGDDERLLGLILSLKNFEQIEAVRIFLNEFPASPQRAQMLLLFGDLIEESAEKLSALASKRLNRAAMAAAGGPVHGYLLNYSGLDRYRKLGVVFFVNARTRKLHYAGTAWREILQKFPDSAEAVEARKRLAALDEKLKAEPV
ncbi:MAG: hypothetical protein IPN69_16060 [Acidobacteria bacterium]|nr:hypothetical protein [Acidobacteriota bacterium]